jgi:hypothetical protein
MSNDEIKRSNPNVYIHRQPGKRFSSVLHETHSTLSSPNILATPLIAGVVGNGADVNLCEKRLAFG